MSDYKYAWSSPGVLKPDERALYSDVFIPFDLENPDFRRFARWVLSGGKCEPADIVPGWPWQATNELPWTLEELSAELLNYPE